MSYITTYSNLTSLVLFTFVMFSFLDTNSNDTTEGIETEYAEFQENHLNLNSNASVFAESITKHLPNSLSYDNHYRNGPNTFGNLSNGSNLVFGTKVKLFILYASLKIAPIV